jgi:ubiquinol-cytochrome c reductase iron-sulfur subunit
MSPPAGSHTDTTNATYRASDHTDELTSVDRDRRKFLSIATAVAGAAGIGLAAVPFLTSLRPSAKAEAVGAPIRVDISRLEPGEQITVIWRGRPVWVLRRTPEMLERMNHEHWLSGLRDPDSAVETQQPPYAQNATRSIRSEYLVVVALCTHLGCVPTYVPEVGGHKLGADWMGGYFCPCHGSRFDLAGRVVKHVPAPTNLVVPPHRFLGPESIQIGVDNA